MRTYVKDDSAARPPVKPFLKWAGGKRWLIDSPHLELPEFEGRYIEPFLGSAAIFFHCRPATALLSDINPRLIETYSAIRDNPDLVRRYLVAYQRKHSKEFYYSERGAVRSSPYTRASQFLYLNRTCWNGLYRENLDGKFNVPIGTKSKIFDPEEDLAEVSAILSAAEIVCQDFGDTVAEAQEGDFVFVDPPYTTAHNLNGFVKYNQKIFSWQDQIRLKDAVFAARERGAEVMVTNANHHSILDLYSGAREIIALDRRSVISGPSAGRKSTSELVIRV